MAPLPPATATPLVQTGSCCCIAVGTGRCYGAENKIGTGQIDGQTAQIAGRDVGPADVHAVAHAVGSRNGRHHIANRDCA